MYLTCTNVLQLTKPVTWVPLIWGVACGAAAAGNYHAIWDGASLSEWTTDFFKAIVCMVLAGYLYTLKTYFIHQTQLTFSRLSCAWCWQVTYIPLKPTLYTKHN